MSRRTLTLLAVVMVACGDATSPGTNRIDLSVEVAHQEAATCEYTLTADGAALRAPAEWQEGTFLFSGGGSFVLQPRYYWGAITLRQGATARSKVLGHGSSQGPWSATVQWDYTVDGRAYTTEVTFRCP